jgi:hypothetical protein
MQTRMLPLLLGALLTPALAGAQPDADRVRTVIRERAVFTPAVARYQRGGHEETDRSSRVLKIGAGGELSLANIAGDIVVTRGGGSDATIEIVKTARGRDAQDAKEMLQLVTVEVTERGSRAEVRAQYPQMNRSNRRNLNVSVAYKVAAPAGTRLNVHSISGNITTTGITGDVSLETISGNVSVGEAGRITLAKSVSGNVEIADTRIEGGLDANSISGNVVARRVTARRLTLESVSGNIVLDTVECERADSQSISGDVEFTGPLARSGRYELKSHSGNVRMTLTGSTGFEIDANSFSGSVRVDGVQLTSRTSGDEPRGRRRSVRGVSGDGSALLNITTFSGNVVVAKR